MLESAAPIAAAGRPRSTGERPMGPRPILPPPEATTMPPDPDPVGLCRRCAHARQVPSRTSRYWRCALAEEDARFERYPRLPVLRCAGFTPAPGDEAGPDEGAPGP